jgi:O-antigen/teichoic acid export membrane protein
MTRIKRLAKEGGWIVAGQIVAVAGALVLVRVLTEHLDPAQYGQLALGLTIAGLVNQVAMGGVASGIGRFYSISLEKGDLWGYLRASNRLMGYATLGSSAIALVMMVGLFLTGQMHWLGMAAAVLLFSIMSGYNSALGGIQNAARQRAIVALHGCMDAWLKIGLTVGVVLWLGSSSTAVVIGYALSALLVIVSQLFFLRRLLRRHGGNTHNSNTEDWVRQMWLFSWPMAVGGLFNWGYYASQRWALELFSTTSQVGQFYALTQIAYSPISMAGAMFLSFLTPVLFARAGVGTDHDRLRNTQRVIIRIALIGFGFTLLIAGISFFIHDIIFRLLVATEYRQMSIYMPYVILSAGILQVSQTLGNILAIENKTIKFLRLSVIGNGGIAMLSIYFTSRWGIAGLITSMAIGATIHLIWMISIIYNNVLANKLSGWIR